MFEILYAFSNFSLCKFDNFVIFGLLSLFLFRSLSLSLFLLLNLSLFLYLYLSLCLSLSLSLFLFLFLSFSLFLFFSFMIFFLIDHILQFQFLSASIDVALRLPFEGERILLKLRLLFVLMAVSIYFVERQFGLLDGCWSLVMMCNLILLWTIVSIRYVLSLFVSRYKFILVVRPRSKSYSVCDGGSALLLVWHGLDLIFGWVVRLPRLRLTTSISLQVVLGWNFSISRIYGWFGRLLVMLPRYPIEWRLVLPMLWLLMLAIISMLSTFAFVSILSTHKLR